MTARQPITAEQRLDRAKESIDNGAPPDYAIAHALIALTEIAQANLVAAYTEGAKVGGEAVADALGQILGVVSSTPPADSQPIVTWPGDSA